MFCFKNMFVCITKKAKHFFWKNMHILHVCLATRIRSLIKPVLENSFSTHVQFTLVGLFPGFTLTAKLSRADPGAKRRKEGLFQKQLPSSKPIPFSNQSDRIFNHLQSFCFYHFPRVSYGFPMVSFTFRVTVFSHMRDLLEGHSAAWQVGEFDEVYPLVKSRSG